VRTGKQNGWTKQQRGASETANHRRPKFLELHNLLLRKRLHIQSIQLLLIIFVNYNQMQKKRKEKKREMILYKQRGFG